MGFERVDRIARDMAGGAGAPAGGPPMRPRRTGSAPVRWAILGLLGIAGVAGAVFFVAGSSGKKSDLRPVALPPAATPPAPDEPALDEPAPDEPAPDEAAPDLQLASADELAARAAQIVVVLDDVDVTLHGLRLTWPGEKGPYPWRDASWTTPERFDQDLARLDQQLVGATDALSLRTREWIAVARPGGARLFALITAWNAPGASADAITGELRPLFDRLVTASLAVHAAVAADLAKPPPGTLAALAWSCRVAPLLARMPLRGVAAPPPIAEAGGAGPPPSALRPEPSPDELRTMALRCYDEGRAFISANPGDQLDYHEIYQLSLTSSLALNLLQEADRRHAPPSRRVFMSTAANMAQESSFLAISRRQYDPSLQQAEQAEAE